MTKTQCTLIIDVAGTTQTEVRSGKFDSQFMRHDGLSLRTIDVSRIKNPAYHRPRRLPRSPPLALVPVVSYCSYIKMLIFTDTTDTKPDVLILSLTKYIWSILGSGNMNWAAAAARRAAMAACRCACAFFIWIILCFRWWIQNVWPRANIIMTTIFVQLITHCRIAIRDSFFLGGGAVQSTVHIMYHLFQIMFGRRWDILPVTVKPGPRTNKWPDELDFVVHVHCTCMFVRCWTLVWTSEAVLMTRKCLKLLTNTLRVSLGVSKKGFRVISVKNRGDSR